MSVEEKQAVSDSKSQCAKVQFTVLICTHNREAWLGQAIDSVLKTTSHEIDYEILIVDNASTDGTKALVEPYLGQNPVRYIYEPKLGLSNARNTGNANAFGEFVVYLDDDGEAAPGWLEGFLKAFEQHPEASGVGGRIVPKFHGKEPAWMFEKSMRFYGAYDLGDAVATCEWVPGGNAAWRLSVIEAAGGFDPNFGRVGDSPALGSEESALIKKVMDSGGVFYYTPYALMYHHIVPEKLKLKWIMTRYYGQGVTSVRWQHVFGRLSERAHAKIHLNSLYKRSVRLCGAAMRSLVLFRAEEASDKFFDLVRCIGEVSETRKLLSRDKLSQGSKAAQKTPQSNAAN